MRFSMLSMAAIALAGPALARGTAPARTQAEERAPLARLHRMMPPSSSFDVLTLLGDIDADGDLDGVGHGYSRLVVYENDGTARFVPGAVQTCDGDCPILLVALVDLDGDRLPDLLSLDGPFPDKVAMRLNMGSGLFSAEATILANTPRKVGYSGCANGDVDADGDQDILAWGGYGYGPRDQTPDTLLINDGRGVFADRSTSLPAATGTRAALLADLDGDGDLDGFAVTSANALRVVLNDGTGVFSPGPFQPAIPPGTFGAHGPGTLRPADFDGDGDVDLLVIGLDTDFRAPNRLLRNRGPARFEDAGQVLPLLHGNSNPFVGDLTGDGLPDVLYLPFSLQGEPLELTLLANRDPGTWVELEGAVPDLGRGYWRFVSGDLDRDGDQDLLAAGSGTALLLNAGRGWLRDVTRAPWEPFDPPHGWAAFGAVDRDPFPDLAVCRGGRVRLLRGDGTGGFVSDLSDLEAGSEAVLAMADVDADGDSDVVTCSSAGTRLFRNDGEGTFMRILDALPDATLRWALPDLVDLDGDGDVDLVLTRDGLHAGRSVLLWSNDGSGHFSDVGERLPRQPEEAYDAEVGDVESDGDLDLWIAGFPEHPLFLATASGGFEEAPGRIPVADETILTGGELVDIDGDGDLDLLCCAIDEYCHPKGYGGCPASFHQLRNDGTGTFAEAEGSWESFYDVQFRELLFQDIDADGDVDVLGDYLRFWRNDGSGCLREESRLVPLAESVGGLAQSDHDLDGDLDSWHGGRLFDNVRTQLAWREIPRLGKPLPMVVHGTPGERWALFVASSRRAPTPTSWGILQLDPRTMFLVGGGRVGRTGEAEMVFEVPPDRALMGAALYWQALAGSPPRLTNLEQTLFTDL